MSATHRDPEPRLPDQVREVIHLRELLAHADVKTTMIYTHVLNRGGRGVVSPADLIRDT